MTPRESALIVVAMVAGAIIVTLGKALLAL